MGKTDKRDRNCTVLFFCFFEIKVEYEVLVWWFFLRKKTCETLCFTFHSDVTVKAVVKSSLTEHIYSNSVLEYSFPILCYFYIPEVNIVLKSKIQ